MVNLASFVESYYIAVYVSEWDALIKMVMYVQFDVLWDYYYFFFHSYVFSGICYSEVCPSSIVLIIF